MKTGDRVRMVQTTSTGTVVGPACPSEVDGSPRVLIRWDRTGLITGWSEDFLRSAESDPADDPDEVESAGLMRRRGEIYLDSNGTVVVSPGGFTVHRAEGQE